MRTQIIVGLAMMSIGPAALALITPVNEAGYKEIAAALVVIGLVGTLWFGYIGYRVLRGGIAVSVLPTYFLVSVASVAAAAVCANLTSR
jgi:hypothetical protein